MVNGIINVYKESGYTSHDVVARLRGIFHQKKIGHTGTLDPDAEGVLPVCLGKATKICEYLTEKDKTYRCVLLLGITTDTQDITGKVIETKPVSVSENDVVNMIDTFVGTYGQIPPMYSALKVNGKKLYELAREGKVIERKARRVTIHKIQIEDVILPRITLEVTCSKGTYIRTLCHDIGQKLLCGGCMENLIRTRVSGFKIEDSVTLKEIENYVQNDQQEKIILPIDSVFAKNKSIYCKKEYQKYVKNGNRLPISALIEWDTSLEKEAQLCLYDAEKKFAGIYAWQEETGDLKVLKHFLEKD